MENVALERADITGLSYCEDHSVDVLFSTVALHHLPDEAVLSRTFFRLGGLGSPLLG